MYFKKKKISQFNLTLINSFTLLKKNCQYHRCNPTVISFIWRSFFHVCIRHILHSILNNLIDEKFISLDIKLMIIS